MNPIDPSAYPTSDELRTVHSPPLGAYLCQTLAVLFKVRVVMLLLFAAAAGAFIAAGGWPGAGTLAVLVVSGGLAAGGASAINQYLEQELDARMERTRWRPLAARSLARTRWIPCVGALMILLPSLAILPFNPALALFLLLGALIYIGIYTVWLKPRTPLNIVVGGAAGSAAVLSGSAAAGNWNDSGALLLALLVFLWTPTHFWSLAIAYRDDYAKGGFPMLPVQTTLRAAAWWVLLHAGGAAIVALALATHEALGWPYLASAVLASTVLLVLSLRLVARPDRRRALALFHASNLYLAIVLSMICVSAVIPV